MKTLRVVNEKYFQQEEIKLSPSDIQEAIREYLANHFAKFQTGWTISVDYATEAKAVCSKLAGFECSKCRTLMTVNPCGTEGCAKLVCVGTKISGKCCLCAK